MNPELFSGQTDKGKQRDNNEDAFIAEALPGGRYIAACVIDGVGGYEGGEVAAAIAKETILKKLKTGSGDLIALMTSSFTEANQKIYEERLANTKTGNMACVLTLAIADPSNNQFHYAHVGDTRLYLFRDHSLVKLTRDHSFVGFLEDNKKLSEEEAMRHPKRNEINKALGFDPNMSSVADYIETGSSPFLPGDILLLCSDGLSDMVDSRLMISVLSSDKKLGQKTKALIEAANDAGGKDNITVVLVQNNKKPVTQKATRPGLIKKKDHPKETSEQETIKDPPIVLVKKTGTGGIVFLTVLCLLLAAAVFYLWNHPRKIEEVAAVKETPPVVTTHKNTSEQKLADSLSSASVLFFNDSVYGKNIVLTDTISFQKDSFHIRGNNITLEADSSFKGPAFFIASSNKYTLIEDLVLKNFDVGIMSQNKKLLLKNVRFVNCRVPVRTEFMLPQERYISGRVADSILFQTDSLPKK
jgi:serine/threonine protein phosphatase PrpC